MAHFRNNFAQFETNLNENPPDPLTSPQPPCFDNEYYSIKNVKQYRIFNDRYHLNTNKTLRNKFKSSCRNKNYFYSKRLRKISISLRKDPRKFWKTLKEGVSSSPQNSNLISSHEWLNIFAIC